jgi:hypothetical protein
VPLLVSDLSGVSTTQVEVPAREGATTRALALKGLASNALGRLVAFRILERIRMNYAYCWSQKVSR